MNLIFIFNDLRKYCNTVAVLENSLQGYAFFFNQKRKNEFLEPTISYCWLIFMQIFCEFFFITGTHLRFIMSRIIRIHNIFVVSNENTGNRKYNKQDCETTKLVSANIGTQICNSDTDGIFFRPAPQQNRQPGDDCPKKQPIYVVPENPLAKMPEPIEIRIKKFRSTYIAKQVIVIIEYAKTQHVHSKKQCRPEKTYRGQQMN